MNKMKNNIDSGFNMSQVVLGCIGLTAFIFSLASKLSSPYIISIVLITIVVMMIRIPINLKNIIMLMCFAISNLIRPNPIYIILNAILLIIYAILTLYYMYRIRILRKS